MTNTPRAKIPAEIQRQVKIEAGHRCAIPTCRQWPVVLAHITPYKTVKDHTFENLIALCPTCHSRFDNSKEIDRKSMIIYKANLGIINSRFMELEKRLLKSLNKNEKLPISGAMAWIFSRLKEDNLIIVVGKSGITMSGIEAHYIVKLTDSGRNLVAKWLGGEPIN